MNDVILLYQTLELSPGASAREVRAAYRRLARRWHPDPYTHDPAMRHYAGEKLRAINDAYERLMRLHGGGEEERGRHAGPPPSSGPSDPTDATAYCLSCRMTMPLAASACPHCGVNQHEFIRRQGRGTPPSRKGDRMEPTSPWWARAGESVRQAAESAAALLWHGFRLGFEVLFWWW